MNKLNLKESSSIESAEYDEATQELVVTFTKGSKYLYSDVPVEMINLWVKCASMKAGSTGSQFHAIIKLGGYHYRKV